MATAPPTGAQEFASIGQGVSGFGGGVSDITSALGAIFGTSASQTQTAGVKGTVTEQLEIDEAGVEKILQDILGGAQGLAPIFSEEQVAGIFGGSVAAQASGNLLANLAGEIAKLTAKKTTATDTTTTTKQKSGTGGLLGQLF